MLGLLSKKDFEAAFLALERTMEERLDGLSERLKQAERRERRTVAALEGMVDEHETMLGLLRRLLEVSPPLEALLSFAESFALWRGAVPTTPETLVLSEKFGELLRQFDLELITDVGEAFDPDRHESCDVRFDPEKPDNSILEVIRPGFLSAKGVMRYAIVVVNRSNKGASQ